MSPNTMTFPPIHTADYHTGGEPFRIVAEPPVDLPGDTVAERRLRAMSDPRATLLRDLLAMEPRGHANTYGGFVVPPDDPGADLGVLFWSPDGYATACGHGTIALATWAVQTGRVSADPCGVTDVVVDMPAGRATASVHTEGATITAVDFVNLPSFVMEREVALTTTRGLTHVDIAFGGSVYAHLDARSVGLRVSPEHLAALIAIGMEVKRLRDDVYGVVVYERLGVTPGGDLRHRNVVVYGNGQIDRSPCGTGTSSRLAVLAGTGELATGQGLVHESIVGSRFVGRIRRTVSAHGVDAVVPVVTGSAYRIGSTVIEMDPRDELVPGFLL